MNLYEVTTVVQFKHTYFVEAKEESHALDEVVMREGADVEDTRYFEEAAQEYLGETIISSRPSSVKEFNEFLKKAETNKRIFSSHWMGSKLIHTIDYEEDTVTVSDPTPGTHAFATMADTLTLPKAPDTITITPYSGRGFYSTSIYEDRQ